MDFFKTLNFFVSAYIEKTDFVKLDFTINKPN